MLEHTHQFAEPEDFDVMFLYFHQHAINFCSLMLFSSCCIRVALWFDPQKCINKQVPLPFRAPPLRIIVSWTWYFASGCCLHRFSYWFADSALSTRPFRRSCTTLLITSRIFWNLLILEKRGWCTLPCMEFQFRLVNCSDVLAKCRGVTKGGTIPRVLNHCEGHRKVPTMTKVLSWIQYICSRKTLGRFEHGSAKLLAPGAI